MHFTQIKTNVHFTVKVISPPKYTKNLCHFPLPQIRDREREKCASIHEWDHSLELENLLGLEFLKARENQDIVRKISDEYPIVGV